jgi:hypothetical protein
MLLRNCLIALWLAAFTSLVFFGDMILPEVMSFDTKIIERLMGQADAFDAYDTVGSYEAIVTVFRYLPKPWDTVFILCVGWVALLALFLPMREPKTIVLASWMILPAVMSAMVRMQKELIVLILALLVILVVSRARWGPLLKTAAILTLYAAYAYFFGRQYYYVIGVVFLYLMMLASAPQLGRFLLVIAAVVAMILVPVSWLQELQQVRDEMTFYRIGTVSLGYRTAFMNYYPVDSLLHFIGNYFYAAARINLPFFFDFGNWKGYYWVTVVMCYAWVLWRGFKGAPENGKILLRLYLSHVLVLNIFEPDAGTYTRHVTSVFLYTLPGLLVLDRSWRDLRLMREAQIKGIAGEKQAVESG